MFRFRINFWKCESCYIILYHPMDGDQPIASPPPTQDRVNTETGARAATSRAGFETALLDSNSMERGLSWEANSHSAIQEIPHILWNTKVHYLTYKESATVFYLETDKSSPQLPYFSKIHSNFTLPSMPRSSKWSLPFRFPTKVLYAFLIYPIHVTCTAHLIHLYLITLIMAH